MPSQRAEWNWFVDSLAANISVGLFHKVGSAQICPMDLTMQVTCANILRFGIVKRGRIPAQTWHDTARNCFQHLCDTAGPSTSPSLLYDAVAATVFLYQRSASGKLVTLSVGADPNDPVLPAGVSQIAVSGLSTTPVWCKPVSSLYTEALSYPCYSYGNVTFLSKWENMIGGRIIFDILSR